MTAHEKTKDELLFHPRVWLITGVSGFIGSNLAESLLRLNQRVVGLDNFATGKRSNLDQVRDAVRREQWADFRLIEGDIRHPETCRQACDGADCVLHHAGLSSVPWSIQDPVHCHENNVTGFLNMLVAARDRRVKRLVYAASCATYGDHPAKTQIEEDIGSPLSPYAVTKYVNELYASVFGRCYGLETIGLRYFNVFGPRQDPEGAYAAVIPKWIAAMVSNGTVFVNGDGKTSRDFCYIGDVTQANLLAATTLRPGAADQVYNVGTNTRTTIESVLLKLTCERPGYRCHREFDH